MPRLCPKCRKEMIVDKFSLQETSQYVTSLGSFPIYEFQMDFICTQCNTCSTSKESFMIDRSGKIHSNDSAQSNRNQDNIRSLLTHVVENLFLELP